MKSLISVISYFFGIIVSQFLGKFFLRGLIKTSIIAAVEDKIFKNFNINQNMENILGSFNSGGDSFLNNSIGNFFVKTFLSKVLFLIIFFCIFSIFRVVKRYILKLTKIAKKLPIIGMIDGFLGAICGVFKAFIFLFIFAIFCFIIIIITDDKLFFLNNECLNSTYLFFLFYKIINFLK